MNITKIYLITSCHGNPNKVYIGKTKRNARESEHKKKFGKDIIFTYIDEIESLDSKDWKPLECFWIDYFKFLGFDLQNKNNGGGGLITHTQEVKDKMSQSHKGIKYSEESKLKMSLSKQNISQETRDKISQANKGKLKPIGFGEKISLTNKGNKRSQETKDKISKFHKGKIISQDMRNKISKSNSKPILQYDLEGNFIKEWNSAKSYANENNLINGTSITFVLKGKSLTAYSSFWIYKKGEIKDKINTPKGIYNKTPIIQYDLEGNFIKEWISRTEASKELNIKTQSISHNLQGRIKKTSNFIFKFKE